MFEWIRINLDYSHEIGSDSSDWSGIRTLHVEFNQELTQSSLVEACPFSSSSLVHPIVIIFRLSLYTECAIHCCVLLSFFFFIKK